MASGNRIGKKRDSKGNVSTRDHVLINGNTLTCQQVTEVARHRLAVHVSAEGRKRARAAHQVMLQAVKHRPVYGHSTGVGANKDTNVADKNAANHGLRLVRSHAAGAGPAVSAEIARAMMVVRLNQLAVGGSGVQPELLDALERALNKNVTPPITRYGAIGTGDLTALATTALCIMGERLWDGGSMHIYTLDTTDALAFMSSNAATLGEAALSCHDLDLCLRAGIKIAALSFLGLGGNEEALHERVQGAHPYPGQIALAAELRKLLGTEYHHRGRRIQDPYCLRALPQVHGAAVDSVNQLNHIVSIEMNAASENPLVDTVSGDIFHNGNFHAIKLALALDGVRAASYNVAALSAARLSALMEPRLTTVRPFLAGGPEASSGVLMLEYVAQSALAEFRHLANPDSLSGAVVSRGTEEHASFATQSAWHTTESVPTYETVLACELVAAMRALGQQKIVPSTGPLQEVYNQAASVLDPSTADRSLETDIRSARQLLRNL